MMKIELGGDSHRAGVYALPISKSLFARRLILLAGLGKASDWVTSQSVYLDLPEDCTVLAEAIRQLVDTPIANYSLSESELSVDSLLIKESSGALPHYAKPISAGESGTAMRFLTAYISATTQTEVYLYGKGKQHARPIAPLVDALRLLGADIEYMGEEGYPPLLIRPSVMQKGRISLDASKSSQYLSALLLIGPLLSGEEDYLIDTSASGVASEPYALMTVEVMREYGANIRIIDGTYIYKDIRTYTLGRCVVEADWTAASYAYGLLDLLLPIGASLWLPRLFLPSLQGDSLYLPDFYQALGIITEVEEEGIRLRKVSRSQLDGRLYLNCRDCPDLVPTLVVSLLGHDHSFSLSGVGHLRIKESNRLEVLRVECLSLGYVLREEEDSLSYDGERVRPRYRPINPYGDHRMAMALSLLSLKERGIAEIEDEGVVAKSFPTYWEVLSQNINR